MTYYASLFQEIRDSDFKLIEKDLMDSWSAESLSELKDIITDQFNMNGVEVITPNGALLFNPYEDGECSIEQYIVFTKENSRGKETYLDYPVIQQLFEGV